MTTPAQRRRAQELEFIRLRKERNELGRRLRVIEKRLDELYTKLYVDADFKDGEYADEGGQ